MTGCATSSPSLPFTVLTQTAVHETNKHKGYWIEIQIPQRKLILAKGDYAVQTYTVAVGTPAYRTPTGSRRVDRVIWNPWWHPPKTSSWVEDSQSVPPRSNQNPLGEIKIPLGDDYVLIHGTRDISSIGRWASHGCIRMLFEDLFGVVQTLMNGDSSTTAIEALEKANQKPTKEFSTPLPYEVPVILTYNPVQVHDGIISISPDFYNLEKEMISLISETITPYLKKDQIPNPKKIKNVLRMFHKETIHVPIKNLISVLSD